jgi:hypothetical protein
MTNSEDAYEASVKQFKENAAAIESSWMSLVDGTNAAKVAACPSLIIETGYMAMGWREGGSVWAICPRCAASGVGAELRVTAGCRQNGDAYGSNLHMCRSCGFTNFSSWDDA